MVFCDEVGEIIAGVNLIFNQVANLWFIFPASSHLAQFNVHWWEDDAVTVS